MHALVIVDAQNDFMPPGSLPVRDGDAVVAVANDLMRRFDLVVATQDWHPADHGSFASAHPGHAPGDTVELGGIEQVLWPDHCVQNSAGASFHSGLDVAGVSAVVRKGFDPEIDSYSGFFDNGHRRDTGMAALLKHHGVTDIVLMGLATDYCVKFTALDARELGFDVTLAVDGCRAVDLQLGDGHRAIEVMAAAGCRIATAADLMGEDS
jgi:nicotinamidase/pyrazinamidase